jgi:hypothetical protein
LKAPASAGAFSFVLADAAAALAEQLERRSASPVTGWKPTYESVAFRSGNARGIFEPPALAQTKVGDLDDREALAAMRRRSIMPIMPDETTRTAKRPCLTQNMAGPLPDGRGHSVSTKIRRATAV